MKRRLTTSTLIVVTLAAGFLAGFLVPDDDFFALRKNFQIFGAVYEELIGGYVDPLDPDKLMRSGIDAMLEDLDPYTNFIDEADNTDLDIITRGRYGGVGLNIGVRNGKITVISPIEGTSGYKQGVRTGDVITEIEGRNASDLTLSDVRHLMRGESGSAVEIAIEREGTPEPIRFILTRQQVELKNVAYAGFADSTSGVGYVKLDRFARDVGGEVRGELQKMKSSGKLNSLILDVRDNPGGLLDGAVEITQLFVPQGSVIVSTRGRLAQTERVYRAKLPPLLPDVPVVVLVNGLSASASEIVAGAIQDLDRGAIVGEPTFGKGLVQIIKPLPYNTSLKMTASKYYTPSGRSIQSIDYGEHDGIERSVPDSVRRTFHTTAGRAMKDGIGIEPDLVIAPGSDSDLEAALDRLAAFFFYANHFAAEHPAVPQDFEVTDDILADFSGWLEEEEFAYRTDAERTLGALESNLAEIGYASTHDEIEALQKAILEEKDADFRRHTKELKERLRSEILSRYHGESAQIEASFRHDTQVRGAVSLLKDVAAYRAILAP